jgi:spore maturation protein CgeB
MLARSVASLRILYIGSNAGTSLHRAAALRRLGHLVRVLDPAALLPNNQLIELWASKTGGLGVSRVVKKWLLEATAHEAYDLVWINGGELVEPGLVRALRARYGRVVNYNNDDPFGSRDGALWRLYLASVREYDLLAVLRECNVAEATKCGAKKVIRVFMSADEVEHQRRPLSAEDQVRWASDVAFLGTWMPERGPFMVELARRGVPLTIYGLRWERAPEWDQLRKFWRGSGLYKGDDYAKAIQCAKVCLGLLSKGNRDLHTKRSVEIPLLGSLLLAERTSEHQALYREDEEAVFWSDAEECAEKCRALLADDTRRRRIASAGRIRCLANGLTNERIVLQILDAIGLGTSASKH